MTEIRQLCASASNPSSKRFGQYAGPPAARAIDFRASAANATLDSASIILSIIIETVTEAAVPTITSEIRPSPGGEFVRRNWTYVAFRPTLCDRPTCILFNWFPCSVVLKD